MMTRLFASAAVAMALAASLPASPLRVLYLGKEDSDSTRHCHVLMRELGRDAIRFDSVKLCELQSIEPMGDIFGPQELVDIQAFLLTLK